jgi:uncharacterized C2H2 Zn-finger protein
MANVFFIIAHICAVLFGFVWIVLTVPFHLLYLISKISKDEETEFRFSEENIFKCDRCGKEYKTKVGYLNHMKNNHFPEEDRLEYDSHTNWKKGLYLVQKGKKVGLYLIPKGIIAPCEYDRISKFDNNSALLILNEKEGLCSIKTGKVRIPCEYQEIHQIKGNYFIVKLNNKYGIIEASLKEKERVIFDCKYDKIEDVGGNYVLLLLGGLYGAANFKTGELRFDCKYENIEIEKHLNTTFLSINDGDKVEYFNVSKDIYQEPKEIYLERNENLEFAKWDRERDKKRKLMEQKIIENKEREQIRLLEVEDKKTMTRKDAENTLRQDVIAFEEKMGVNCILHFQEKVKQNMSSGNMSEFRFYSAEYCYAMYRFVNNHVSKATYTYDYQWSISKLEINLLKKLAIEYIVGFDKSEEEHHRDLGNLSNIEKKIAFHALKGIEHE